MFPFQARNRQNAAAASPRGNEQAVGEIDTKPPFESVKAAVTMFVEASPKADKPVLKKTRTIEESVLGRETQLHWILKEIDKFKEHVKTAEAMKAQALGELEKANKTLNELTNRLQDVSESKHASIEETEASKARLEQLENQPAWQEAVDSERDQYKEAAKELIAAKKQLNKLKHDFEMALVAKQTSFQRAAEAQHAAKVNRKKISQLSKDVEAMSQTLERVKIASAKAEEDHDRRMEEKEALIESKKEDLDSKRTECLNKKVDPASGNLEKRLKETSEAVNVLRDQLEEVRAADMEMLKTANSEVDEAKMRLIQVQEEEKSIRDMVESLKRELEDVRRDITVCKEDELKSQELRVELDQIKLQVQEAITKETIAATHVNELESKLHELWSEAEKATEQEQEMKKQVEIFWREAQRSELAIQDTEAKLETARKQVEEAKAAKELADDQIRKQSSSKKEETDSGIVDDDSNTIALTTQDFEALSRKAEEATTAADTKVATITAQLETIKEKEKGVLEKLEKGLHENKEIQQEIDNAQSTADAARQSVEKELHKWRQEAKP
ncbi:WEB family protein At5g55860-like [Bidens hawaiensis]|uniref:WEB family protein At5g55860-like n=1 Tax=Bidens hawaiensis TaxID=980011 RepID=UPI00404A4B7A